MNFQVLIHEPNEKIIFPLHKQIPSSPSCQRRHLLLCKELVPARRAPPRRVPLSPPPALICISCVFLGLCWSDPLLRRGSSARGVYALKCCYPLAVICLLPPHVLQMLLSLLSERESCRSSIKQERGGGRIQGSAVVMSSSVGFWINSWSFSSREEQECGERWV